MEKKLRHIVLGTAIALACVACEPQDDRNYSDKSLNIGNYNGAKHYSGTIGTCTMVAKGIPVCSELAYSGMLNFDPSKIFKTTSQIECNNITNPSEGLTGTFAADATCDRSTMFAYCTIQKDTEGFLRENISVYKPPLTPEVARKLCDRTNGIYSIVTP